MNRPSTLASLLFATVLSCGMCLTAPALANSGKESSAGGDSSAKLEAFTVNLGRTDQYLQLVLTLQLSSGEFAEKVKLFMPVVRHNLIVLLSSKEPADLQSSAGKKELIEQIKTAVNKALNAKEHDGVTDIFFENFVIQ